MKKVYRIEHKDLGIGPLCREGYEITHISWWSLAIDHNDVREAYDDIFCKEFVKLEHHHVFGMSTLKKLKHLFRNGETIRCLQEMGFGVFEFVVSKMVKFPDGQVIFSKHDVQSAKLLDVQ